MPQMQTSGRLTRSDAAAVRSKARRTHQQLRQTAALHQMRQRQRARYPLKLKSSITAKMTSLTRIAKLPELLRPQSDSGTVQG